MSSFDFDFRPSSYWDHLDPLAAILANIKGQNRRRMVRGLITAETPKRHEIPSGFLEAGLDPGTRSQLGGTHPSWMGGEYLPDYLPGEVEIARIVLRSVAQDVISFRARRRRGGRRLLYRVVDEFQRLGGARWTCRPASSARPLSLGELVALIDGSRNDDIEVGPGPLTDELRSGYAANPKEMLDFVTVESDLYPMLFRYYEERAEDWLRRQRLLLKERPAIRRPNGVEPGAEAGGTA
jgi:hypothetical protein